MPAPLVIEYFDVIEQLHLGLATAVEPVGDFALHDCLIPCVPSYPPFERCPRDRINATCAATVAEGKRPPMNIRPLPCVGAPASCRSREGPSSQGGATDFHRKPARGTPTREGEPLGAIGGFVSLGSGACCDDRLVEPVCAATIVAMVATMVPLSSTMWRTRAMRRSGTEIGATIHVRAAPM